MEYLPIVSLRHACCVQEHKSITKKAPWARFPPKRQQSSSIWTCPQQSLLQLWTRLKKSTCITVTALCHMCQSCNTSFGTAEQLFPILEQSNNEVSKFCVQNWLMCEDMDIAHKSCMSSSVAMCEIVHLTVVTFVSTLTLRQ